MFKNSTNSTKFILKVAWLILVFKADVLSGMCSSIKLLRAVTGLNHPSTAFLTLEKDDLDFKKERATPGKK